MSASEYCFHAMENCKAIKLLEGTSPSASPTVYLVCDDAARRAIAASLASAGWNAQGFASTDELLLEERPSGASCLVLDAASAAFAVTDLLERLAAVGVDMPVIVIMGDSNVSMAVRLMKAGAIEVLTKPIDSQALVNAVAEALARSHALLAAAAETRTIRARYATLSAREREVIALVALGRLNRQIALELGISEITVKAHRGRMMRKMMARSLAQLVLMYASVTTGPSAH